jgi:DNA modification methylase
VSFDLRLGDCIEGMRALADKSVDHVICDPPYASEIYQRCKKNPARNSGKGRGHRGTNKVSVSLKALTEGAIGTLDDCLSGSMAHIARVTRRWALVFCDVESLHLIKSALVLGGMRYVRTGCWAKTDPMPQFSGDRPAQGFEACAIAHSSETRSSWNGGGSAALWTYGVCKVDRPDHPCPKPVDLMERLIRDFTDPGETVLDPFAGSGTTGVAAIRLGRRFIGFERDEKYYAIATKRLAAAREQLGLFAEGA